MRLSSVVPTSLLLRLVRYQIVQELLLAFVVRKISNIKGTPLFANNFPQHQIKKLHEC